MPYSRTYSASSASGGRKFTATPMVQIVNSATYSQAMLCPLPNGYVFGVGGHGGTAIGSLYLAKDISTDYTLDYSADFTNAANLLTGYTAVGLSDIVALTTSTAAFLFYDNAATDKLYVGYVTGIGATLACTAIEVASGSNVLPSARKARIEKITDTSVLISYKNAAETSIFINTVTALGTSNTVNTAQTVSSSLQNTDMCADIVVLSSTLAAVSFNDSSNNVRICPVTGLTGTVTVGTEHTVDTSASTDTGKWPALVKLSSTSAGVLYSTAANRYRPVTGLDGTPSNGSIVALNGIPCAFAFAGLLSSGHACGNTNTGNPLTCGVFDLTSSPTALSNDLESAGDFTSYNNCQVKIRAYEGICPMARYSADQVVISLLS